MLIINLIGSKITWDTKLWAYLWMSFLTGLIEVARSTLNVVAPVHGLDSGLNIWEKKSLEPSFISLYFLRMECD